MAFNTAQLAMEPVRKKGWNDNHERAHTNYSGEDIEKMLQPIIFATGSVILHPMASPQIDFRMDCRKAHKERHKHGHEEQCIA